MSDHAEGLAQIHVPTIKQRVARRLGFGWRFGPDPAGADEMSGWFVTETRFRFGWKDRLRLLWSGALDVRVVGYPDLPVREVKSRMDYVIHFDSKGADQ